MRRVEAINSLWEERVSARENKEMSLFRRFGKGSLRRWIPEVGGRWVKS
jgi:hypothetical protein